MSQPSSRLQRTLNGTPVPFRLGDYISLGFEFMNKNFGMLLAFMLVSTMISFVAQIIPLAGIILSLLIAPVLQIGYAQFTYAALHDRRVDFSEFFKGFNKIGPLVATYLLTMIIAVIAALPGILILLQAGVWDWIMAFMEQYPYVQDMPDMGETLNLGLFSIGILVTLVAVLAVSSLFSWSLFLVWFYDIGPMEALSASRKLIARHWGTFIIFLIITGLIAGAGALLCLVGILYTAPAMACAQFFAFADATQLMEDEAENPDDLMDHFIA